MCNEVGAKPEMPKSVQIGPYEWSINDSEYAYLRASADNNARIWGYTRYPQTEIILCPDQNEQHKRMALMHESLHAIWHVHDPTHDCDEEIVRWLAGGILELLRRNPELVAYLTGD